MSPPRILAFDPTPAGLITPAKSLRLAFKYQWKLIRQRHFKDGDLGCEICPAVAAEARHIHAHEVYSFPNAQIVHLDRIIFICTDCHDTIHLERTRGRSEKPYIQKLEEHYCRVNGGLSAADLKKDFAEAQRRGFALREFYGGSATSPDIDYGAYRDGVEQTLARKRQQSADLDDDYDGDFEIFPDHECPWDVGHS
jgi:hypothetical protein